MNGMATEFYAAVKSFDGGGAANQSQFLLSGQGLDSGFQLTGHRTERSALDVFFAGMDFPGGCNLQWTDCF